MQDLRKRAKTCWIHGKDYLVALKAVKSDNCRGVFKMEIRVALRPSICGAQKCCTSEPVNRWWLLGAASGRAWANANSENSVRLPY